MRAAILLLLVLALAIGCTPSNAQYDERAQTKVQLPISYFYDETHGVGIWIYHGYGIAVVPVSQFRNPDKPAMLR